MTSKTDDVREAVARIIDPLVFELIDALDNAEGEPEQLRNDATKHKDERLARAFAKADHILALISPAPAGVAGELKPNDIAAILEENADADENGLHNASQLAEKIYRRAEEIAALSAAEPAPAPVAVDEGEAVGREQRLSAALIALVEHFERVDAGPEDKAAIQTACQVWADVKRDKALYTHPPAAQDDRLRSEKP